MHVKKSQWTVTDVNLDSDHCIVQTDLELKHPSQQLPEKTWLIGWDEFRKQRPAKQVSQNSADLIDLQSWTTQLVQDPELVTKTDPEIPADKTEGSHLLHLWVAQKIIREQWRGNKYNRKLKRKLAELGKQHTLHKLNGAKFAARYRETRV